ncbi:MAG: hypothetical protein ABFS19_01635 [Thermodesulfobacteriota bacterium]
MSTANRPPYRQGREKKGHGPLIKILIIVVVALIGGYLYQQYRSEQQDAPPAVPSQKQASESLKVPDQQTGRPPAESGDHPSSQPGLSATGDLPDNYEGDRRDHDKDSAAQPVGQTGTVATTPGKAASPVESCRNAAADILKFYQQIDSREYIRNYQLDQPSSTHFTALIKKLLKNPPVIARETDDLFTILKNTAHFFRILGKDNVLIIKGILHKEKGEIEDLLANYHTLTHSPECSDSPIYISASSEGLYLYAGFFLNTMGGRLYLFRRDSLSRMVVSYYSIITIDEANTQKANAQGIEVTSAVDMLISEIETGGNHLKYRDEYLDKLYELKEKYDYTNP